jgi:hypothetical protein
MRSINSPRCCGSFFPLSVLPLFAVSVLFGAVLNPQARAGEKFSSEANALVVARTTQSQVAQGTANPPDPEAQPAEEAPAAGEGETPAAGEGETPAAGANQLSGPTAGPDEVVTIPRSSAIIVSFPAELILDPKRQHNVPITLPLLQPIVDTDGQIVAPAKSLVSAQLKAMKGGDLIEIISVVVGGRVIPINAMGTLVPAQNKPEDVANPIVGSPGRLNNILTSLQQSSTFANQLTISTGGNRRLNGFDIADLAISLGAGLTTPVPKVPPAFVSITQGSVYILTLASPVTVPKRLVETGIQIRESLGEEGIIPTAQ